MMKAFDICTKNNISVKKHKGLHGIKKVQRTNWSVYFPSCSPSHVVSCSDSVLHHISNSSVTRTLNLVFFCVAPLGPCFQFSRPEMPALRYGNVGSCDSVGHCLWYLMSIRWSIARAESFSFRQKQFSFVCFPRYVMLSFVFSFF